MGLGHRRVAVIQSEKKYDEWSEGFGDEEDAGVVSGVIVGESNLADVADGVSEEPYRVRACGGKPKVSTEPRCRELRGRRRSDRPCRLRIRTGLSTSLKRLRFRWDERRGPRR